MAKSSKHILMIPAPAFGHIIPLLELGKKLSEFHRITFAIPDHMVNDIRKRGGVTQKNTNLHLMGVAEGFRDRAEERKGNVGKGDLMQLFNSHTLLLNSVLGTLGEKDKPNYAIIDSFAAHLGPTFKEKQISFYHFNTAAAGSMLLKGILYDDNCPLWYEEDGAFPLWSSSDWGLQPLPQFEKDVFKNIKTYLHLAEGVIVNGPAELEPESLLAIHKSPLMNGKSLFMVGPLIPNDPACEGDKAFTEWLNDQKANSVVYVSLGSIAQPRPEQVKEMAEAFLLMKHPFIWSLPTHLMEHLPEELKNQNDSRFRIVNWAPQKLILAHPSTSLFVSHCGWNSTLETLANGVPVVGWPMFADQGLNNDLLVKQGSALRIEGTGMKPKRVVPAKEIVENIDRVMEDASFKENAVKGQHMLRAVIEPNGSSYKQTQELLSAIHQT